MNRRNIIKNMLVGAISGKSILNFAGDYGVPKVVESLTDHADQFRSKWHVLPNMSWIGEDLWPQRLQDWCVKDGELKCLAHGPDRTVNVLTHQFTGNGKTFKAEMDFRFLNPPVDAKTHENYIAFRLGLKGRFTDYRSAIFTGKGINAGLTRNGKLFIGDKVSDHAIAENKLKEQLRLSLSIELSGATGSITRLSVLDKNGTTLSAVSSVAYKLNDWKGNIAIASHFKNIDASNTPTISVKSLLVEGDQIEYRPDQVFGPIYFAQYTTHAGVLKLTAQLAPIDIAGVSAKLQIKKENKWTEISRGSVHPLARTASFRVENWDQQNNYPYRVVYQLKLTDGTSKVYSYEGSIAAEPSAQKKITAVSFSCNWDYGFPDNEVVENASKHKADIAFFLGDQFYEPNGGFDVQMAPLEKATLDYLRKWYMFGWSYRDLFRHIPMVALPDDHDVYHGNVWGCGGRPAVVEGNTYQRQDSGGYKMPAQWVNMAQVTQTSHMPDPFDPAPVQQGITVYYATWKYAGINFAIIEDRKFKSAPKDILPAEARVVNGFSENEFYDRAMEKEMEAQLLGQRQLNYLSKWIRETASQSGFRVLVSATPFFCLQTLPPGEKLGQLMTPSLPIPGKDEYIKGDVLVKDMDSNGWPHNRRDEALKLLANNMDLHLVGDQHLPAVVQYGTDQYRDNSFCFAVPALNNVWPRRWYPPLKDGHQPLPGKPAYTGDFEDGFGNKITVYAAANPYKTGREPAILHDRVTGYGVVEFDKANDKITMHCWPRYADPEKGNGGQFSGWPLTISKSKLV